MIPRYRTAGTGQKKNCKDVSGKHRDQVQAESSLVQHPGSVSPVYLPGRTGNHALLPGDGPTDEQLIKYALEIKDEPREYAYVFDSTGKVLFCLKGERAAIQFGYRDRFRLFQTIFLHNHPLGSSFSLADIQVACVFNMQAMLAATRTHLFILTPPKHDPFFTRSHYQDIARCYRIRSSMLPLSQRLTVCDQLWDAVSVDMDMTYTRVRIDESPLLCPEPGNQASPAVKN